jgi:trimethylamine corrinoid protein
MSKESIIEEAKTAVMTYNNKAAAEVAKKAIAEGVDIVDVIQEGFTKGMTEVGALFEAKKLYLPHVMAAAAAMNAAMDVLNPELEKKGTSVESALGTVVICTIEGDIHSLGKDIVALMLKVSGFDVKNIGRDIQLDKIVDSCKTYKPVALGTSALMTSTMVFQKTLEEKLKAAGVRESLLTNVGGAPVTQKWADEIGADLYTENASDAVAKFTAAFEKS